MQRWLNFPDGQKVLLEYMNHDEEKEKIYNEILSWINQSGIQRTKEEIQYESWGQDDIKLITDFRECENDITISFDIYTVLRNLHDKSWFVGTDILRIDSKNFAIVKSKEGLQQTLYGLDKDNKLGSFLVLSILRQKPEKCDKSIECPSQCSCFELCKIFKKDIGKNSIHQYCSYVWNLLYEDERFFLKNILIDSNIENFSINDTRLNNNDLNMLEGLLFDIIGDDKRIIQYTILPKLDISSGVFNENLSVKDYLHDVLKYINSPKMTNYGHAAFCKVIEILENEFKGIGENIWNLSSEEWWCSIKQYRNINN